LRKYSRDKPVHWFYPEIARNPTRETARQNQNRTILWTDWRHRQPCHPLVDFM